MTVHRLLSLPLVLALSQLFVEGDTLTLRNGTVIQGTFLAGTTRQIDFLDASGKTHHVAVGEVAAMKIAALPAAPAGDPPASKRRTVIVPAGTQFLVRTIDAIDVDKTEAGAKFHASLDDPIMVAGNVVVPRGADVLMVAAKVQQGGKFKGSDLIQLKVNAIAVGSHMRPVVTSLTETKSEGEGKKTARKIGGGAGLGAIIGGIAGGGKGAAIGVLSGAAAGTIVSASGQPHLKVPPETRLQFQLVADWKVQ